MSQYNNYQQGGNPQQPAYNQAPYGGQNPYPPYMQQPGYAPQFVPQPMTLGNWLVTMLVLSLPLIGIIMTFVWGFGDQEHPSRKTYCQAVLVWSLIATVIGVIVLLVTGVSLGALFAAGEFFS